jgi:hypothetical protein
MFVCVDEADEMAGLFPEGCRLAGEASLGVGLSPVMGGGRMTAVETKAPAEVRKFPLTTLIAMVVGSMVGAGIFSLPRNFGLATGVYGALIAWAIAGTGMLMLAFVFQTLAVRKPDLDAGYMRMPRLASAITWVSSPRGATGPARASGTSPTGC